MKRNAQQLLASAEAVDLLVEIIKNGQVLFLLSDINPLIKAIRKSGVTRRMMPLLQEEDE